MSIPKLVYKDGTPMRAVQLKGAAKEISDEIKKDRLELANSILETLGNLEEFTNQDPAKVTSDTIDKMVLEQLIEAAKKVKEESSDI
jgi:DNA polymerase elongation subunit (family B)